MNVRRLKSEAHASARFRGHNMTNFKRSRTIAGGEVFFSKCKACDMDMIIRTRPRANEYNLVGEALALTCDTSPKPFGIVIYPKGEYKPGIAGPIVWGKNWNDAQEKADSMYPNIPVVVERA